MYNYHIPKHTIQNFNYFSDNEILEAQQLKIEESLFPYFKSLYIDKLYAQNYPMDFLIDIVFKNPLFDNFFQEIIEDGQHKTINPLIFPSVHGFYDQYFKKISLYLDSEISVNQKEKVYEIRNSSDPLFRQMIINSIHAFSLKENNIALQLNDNNTVLDYNIHHIRHGMHYGFNFVSENEILLLKENIIQSINLESLFKLDLQDEILPFSSDKKSYKNYQNYIHNKTLTLHKADNNQALKTIKDCLIEAKDEYAYVEGKDHNDFTINYNFTSNLTNIAYFNLQRHSSEIQLTYKTFNNFLENTVITKLVNDDQDQTLTQLNKIVSSIENLNIAHHILLNNQSFYEPKMLELTSFLHNLSTSLSPKEYNINNIKKYAPEHIFNFLLYCIENVNNKSREILLNTPTEELFYKNPSTLLAYIYPLLNKYTQTETLPLFDSLFKTMEKPTYKIKNNQSVDNWRHEQFTDYYSFNSNLNFFYNSVPFASLSFEEAILKTPNITEKISLELSKKTEKTLDISLTSIPSFVSKAITYIDDHLNNNFFKKEFKISYQNLYKTLSIIQETLDNFEAKKLVNYITPNVDISFYEKINTPILYKDFTKKVILENQNNNQSYYYCSPFLTLISEYLDQDSDYFRKADLNILQNYWDSKPLFYIGASSLSMEYGFKNPINLFSKDFKEIPVIFSKFPEYKEYVINKNIIGQLLEENSPYLQHPEIQQFLRSYNGVSILTDSDYLRPPLDVIFPEFNEEEKKQLSQFFINPEMFILEGLYKDTTWMNYLSEETLNDPEYIIEVINQTFNFYKQDDAIKNSLKFLQELPQSFLINEHNFQTVSSAIKNKIQDNFYVYLHFCENFYKNSSYALQNSQNFIFELDSINTYIKNNEKNTHAHYGLIQTLLINANPLLKNQLVDHPKDVDETLEKILSQIDKIVMNLEIQDNSLTALATNTRKATIKKF